MKNHPTKTGNFSIPKNNPAKYDLKSKRPLICFTGSLSTLLCQNFVAHHLYISITEIKRINASFPRTSNKSHPLGLFGSNIPTLPKYSLFCYY